MPPRDALRDPPVPARPLSPRQLAVARLCGQGRTYAEIAAALGIKRHTVRHHVKTLGVLLSGTAEARIRATIYGARLLALEEAEHREAA